MDFILRLVIEDIKELPASSNDCNLIAKVEWRGNEKAGLLAGACKKNYTCQKRLQENGSVSWNEGFDHACKFKRGKSESFRSWIIALQIKEVQGKVGEKKKNIGKAKLNIGEFVQFENVKTIRIPINCSVKNQTAQAMLMLKLQLFKLESVERSQVILTGCFSPYSCRSAGKNNMPAEEGQIIRNETRDQNDHKKHIMNKHSNRRKLGRNRTRAPEDDVDDENCNESCIMFLKRFKEAKVRPVENFNPLGLINERHRYEAGRWERRKLVSRDEKMELSADVYLASIDQCSRRAAGGSACTVLAAVVADWLHKNPKSLPTRGQFDELVLRGSLQWRNLCKDETNRAKFSDKHFDLDTVLVEKIKSLAVVTEKSCVGFFPMEELPESFDFLHGDMSFDTIWDGILCTDESEEKIYIASWNDHFFVLKVEKEAIYLLDTLGERLTEGCNQAYILKFDSETAIYRRSKEGEEDLLISRGVACCKEYIKGFLSAIPLSGLQEDIKRGRAKEELLHRLLQIDFHFTAPKTAVD